MAINQNSPFGFRYVGLDDGTEPNFGLTTGRIAASNTNKIFSGDVLNPSMNGYFDVATEIGGGAPIGGIAVGFSWPSRSLNTRVRQGWWPGNGDSTGDIQVFVARNWRAVFEVQCLLGPMVNSSVGKQANFSVGGGGSGIGAQGKSSFTLDDGTLAYSSSLPFTVYGFNSDGIFTLVTPGWDQTQPYNLVKVMFNNVVLGD